MKRHRIRNPVCRQHNLAPERDVGNRLGRGTVRVISLVHLSELEANPISVSSKNSTTTYHRLRAVKMFPAVQCRGREAGQGSWQLAQVLSLVVLRFLTKPCIPERLPCQRVGRAHLYRCIIQRIPQYDMLTLPFIISDPGLVQVLWLDQRVQASYQRRPSSSQRNHCVKFIHP